MRNGIVPATLPQAAIAQIAAQIYCEPHSNLLTVDLTARILRTVDGRSWDFTIPADARDMLLNGLDAIEQTLLLRDQVEMFRAADRIKRPWAYACVATAGRKS